jgi:hypothetical protein
VYGGLKIKLSDARTATPSRTGSDGSRIGDVIQEIMYSVCSGMSSPMMDSQRD